MKKTGFLYIFIFIGSVCFLLMGNCFAEVIQLIDGKTYEGEIVEKTDYDVKIQTAKGLVKISRDRIDQDSQNFIFQDRSLYFSAAGEAALGDVRNNGRHFENGTHYLWKGQWADAITEFSRIGGGGPASVGSFYNLGCAYALNGDDQQALEIFRQATLFEDGPFSAFVFFNIAGIYTKNALMDIEGEDFKRAVINFKKAESYYRKAQQKLPGFHLAAHFAYRTERLSRLSVERLSHLKKKIVFYASEERFPPDSGVFSGTEPDAPKSQFDNYAFDAGTVPMIFFWHSPAVKAIVAQSSRHEDARQLFEEAFEDLSFFKQTRFHKMAKRGILINFLTIYLRILGKDQDALLEKAEWVLEELQKLEIDPIYEDAVAARVYLLKGDRGMAKELAEKVLLQDLDNDIAKSVLHSLK